MVMAMAVALKTLIQFPIFTPRQPHHHRPATEVRFSRWNNANAEKFNQRRRAQKEIEDELRLVKRFNSTDRIVDIYENATSTTTKTTTDSGNANFKSIGTPSRPSRPSIPGRASKYSKNPKPRKKSSHSHPAFRPILNLRKLPNEAEKAETGVKVDESGVSYSFPNAPFEFQYSYTETPQVKPLKLREPPIPPFEPDTMPRPWTGRKPLPPSKKKLEFDSFRLPPPHKKGVKPVQAPGPFLPGSGPKYVQSREEILGEPLTKEEIDELVNSCKKSSRQLNMGRDGLTHNMLDNIHSHWKRRRVCKIKCKGVCTVDMDNVRQQLEEKTGGKIIHSTGGVIYLFRGRNYNYKTRPRFPLMLWKPITPVYPRLIQHAPEGLTLEEAAEMRKKGRNLTPIWKLGKNGVYSNLVKDVREAFEACELVRINCQGMNGSDYRKIGAKLKDLVPCVLISFEHEHILMWRGRDWESSLPKLEDDRGKLKQSEIDDAYPLAIPLDGQAEHSCIPDLMDKDTSLDNFEVVASSLGIEKEESTVGSEDLIKENSGNLLALENDNISSASAACAMGHTENESGCIELYTGRDDNSKTLTENHEKKDALVVKDSGSGHATTESVGSLYTKGESGSPSDFPLTHENQDRLEELNNPHEQLCLSSPCYDGVMLLLKQAVERGMAVVLDNSSLDADIVYKNAVALAQSAPPGPAFRHRPKRVVAVQKSKQEPRDSETKDIVAVSQRVSEGKNSRNQRTKDFKQDLLNVVPQGSLRVDELAKLLA